MFVQPCYEKGKPPGCDLYTGSTSCLEQRNADQSQRCDYDEKASLCHAFGQLIDCSVITLDFTCSIVDHCVWVWEDRKTFKGKCWLNTSAPSTTTTPTTTPTTVDVDPCQESPKCDPQYSQCQRNREAGVSAFTCTPCPVGTTGDPYLSGGGCRPVTCPLNDFSAIDPHLQASCFITGYQDVCTYRCKDGYTLSGNTSAVCGAEGKWVATTTCSDTNECANKPCGTLRDCVETTTPGEFTRYGQGFTCTACPAGYRESGLTCTDVNECFSNAHNCHQLATCTNTDGSFTCSGCPTGYSGDGVTNCDDINECTTNNPCNVHTNCTNTIGNFRCSSCPNGYNIFNDGVDQPDQPGCVIRRCPEALSSIQADRATYDCGSAEPVFGAKCKSKCLPGYEGLPTDIFCGQWGFWENVTFRCQPVTCPPMTSATSLPANALFNSTCVGSYNTIPRAECEVRCKPGFSASNVVPFTCGTDKTWVNGSVTCAACPAGFYQDEAGMKTCKPVTTKCKDDEYISQYATSSSDTMCTAVKKCNRNREYETTAPTATTDRVCATATTCNEWTYLQQEWPAANEAWAQKDRVCGNLPCVQCDPGTPAKPGVYRRKNICDGHHVMGGLNPNDPADVCTACTKCHLEDGQYTSSACTRSEDAVCSTVRACPIGFPEVRSPSVSANRQCSTIPADPTDEPPEGLHFVLGTMTIDVDTDNTNTINTALYRVFLKVFGAKVRLTIFSITRKASRRRGLLFDVSYRMATDPTEYSGAAAASEISADKLTAALQQQSGFTQSSVAEAPAPSVSGASEESSGLPIAVIAGAAAGGLLLIVIVVVIMTRRNRRAGQSADITMMDEMDDGKPMEMLEIKGGMVETRTRQSSFYSSIAHAGSEA